MPCLPQNSDPCANDTFKQFQQQLQQQQQQQPQQRDRRQPLCGHWGWPLCQPPDWGSYWLQQPLCRLGLEYLKEIVVPGHINLTGAMCTMTNLVIPRLPQKTTGKPCSCSLRSSQLACKYFFALIDQVASWLKMPMPGYSVHQRGTVECADFMDF